MRMKITAERLEELVDRRQLFVRELAAHVGDPANFPMTAAPLVPGVPMAAAEKVGIVADPEISGRVSPAVMLHTHAMLMKPKRMKSPLDAHIQDRIDEVAEPAMAERRRFEHQAKTRRDGTARASAAPRSVDTGSGDL
jgi:hypothetical protein